MGTTRSLSVLQGAKELLLRPGRAPGRL